MRQLMPWTGMTTLRQEMDRLFDRFFERGWLERGWDEFPAVGEWAPSVDLSETKDALVIKAEIPGMEMKDVEVSLDQDVLTIKGEKKQEKEEKDERHHRVERSYGAFTRRVRLPVGVDASKVKATFKNGLLVVTMPKAPGAKATAIPVKAE